MAFKNILICLNDIDNATHLLVVAREVAGQFKAHITALYLLPPDLKFRTTAYVNAPEPKETNRAYFESHLEATRAKFGHFMQGKLSDAEFVVADTDLQLLAKGVVSSARLHDLTIASATRGRHARGLEDDFVEQVVLQSGRPVLVLPHHASGGIAFDRILLAWDHGREAARAVSDALPFLERARQVFVVSIDGAKQDEASNQQLVKMLKDKGVKAEAENVASGGETTGEALRLSAQHHQAGLIVMGCYGHSRFAELVVGGTSRQMASTLDRPVLMSH